MLRRTLSEIDTLDFLSPPLKGGEVDFPEVWWQAPGDAILPYLHFKGHKERNTSQHEHVERSDIAQLPDVAGALNEIDLVSALF
jgi:hypothetical protein